MQCGHSCGHGCRHDREHGCGEHSEHHVLCLERVPIFAGLSREEKLEVAQISSSRSYDKGEMVYQAGDAGGTLFVLYTGKVKLFRLDADGREQVLRVIGPGEFMGELSLFSSLPLTDNALALEDSIMCVLQGERLKELMSKYPSIAFKVMDELSRRLEAAERRIEAISLHTVTRRVAGALLELSAGKNEIILPMSKRDLASQLGMSQETLSRKLTELENEGLIGLRGQRRILIKRRPELENLSRNQEF
ncbi:MAG TPA: Crp/Fnr family transcriptional regulator [Firmicutes bacterium]|nr:Crp/Fnr family transcriptional regulator [Bacillota bacterium]